MAASYDKLITRHKFKCQTVFSARFDKQDEDGQLLDEIVLKINRNINLSSTEQDNNNIDINSPLEHQTQNQGTKDSGWRFDKLIQ